MRPRYACGQDVRGGVVIPTGLRGRGNDNAAACLYLQRKHENQEAKADDGGRPNLQRQQYEHGDDKQGRGVEIMGEKVRLEEPLRVVAHEVGGAAGATAWEVEGGGGKREIRIL